jgi:hypothetical protein
MTKINICLIKPDNYIHSYAFLELGELIYFSSKDLGFDATLSFNQIDPNAKNIIIGCHLLDPSLIAQVPKSSIILNTEQIYSDTVDWSKNIYAWVKNFEVWDYSRRNIEKLNELGVIKAKLFKIGFQRELVRLDTSKTKDIDVLFYGSMNERRKDIIEKLVSKGLKVKSLFGVYGKERDDWVARSKLVLNHHFYSSQIFEIIRVFYLLTNSVAVVGEVNDSTSIDDIYRDGIYAAKYDDLVSGCLALAKDDVLRQRMQAEALNSISKYPQKIFTQEAFES